MALILCIETATTNCSVAISKDGKLLDFREDNDKNYSHAEKLHLFIEEILKANHIQPNHLDAIAVSKGPGSYTGLRIGVSSAKGLCFSLDIPLISIETLKNLAKQVEVERGTIIPLLDARRMEVYAAGFTHEHNPLFPTRAQILDSTSYDEFLNSEKAYFIGDGVEKFKEICNHPNAVFIEGKLPRAIEMVEPAFLKFKNAEFENVAYFEPYYLKDFILG